MDTLCAARFPEVSRSQWTSRGTFKHNDKNFLAKTKAKTGEIWEIEYEESINFLDLPPWDFPLKVLKESEHWAVIEKPEGICVHPSPSDPSPQTILNALIAQFGKNLSENFDDLDGQKLARPGLVHRLDKETSGVLLVAKNNAAHTYFQNHWNQVEKTYYALVEGAPPLKGKIEAGILRDPKNRQKMTVSLSEKSKSALTYFEREAYNPSPKISLLKIKIPTGRTHQIRVHLSSIGFKILGDEKYGGIKAPRLMLHAFSLRFPDPKTKKQVLVESPLPSIFQTFL